MLSAILLREHPGTTIVTDSITSTGLAKFIEEKGGIAVCDGQVTKYLPLPIAGLMTPLLPEQVSKKHIELKDLAASMGCTINAPFMTLAFMAMPVIPDLKLTDKYLFDGIAFCETSLWAD
mgnify:CR=1 FL=1